MAADIDLLLPTRNLIDLNSHSDGNFDLDNFTLTQVYGDIILVELTDLSADGDLIKRGNLFVPLNAVTKAWRKAKVILVGTDVKHTAVGDIVLFPNDRGVSVSGVEVEGYGTLKKGMFLNEARLFGKCNPRAVDAE